MSLAHNEGASQSNKVADDWEDVGEEQVIAQIAERQKQLVAQKNEAEQLKLPEGADDGQQPGPANPLGDRPVRLLRRPQSESKLGRSGGDQSDSTNRPMTFEERQAAYEQARERIFGPKSTTAEGGEEPASEDTSPSTDSGPTVETMTQPPDRRNHLSDVPMKTSNIAPQRAWPPGPPQQPMWAPPVAIPITAIPAYGGYGPPQTSYGGPLPPPQPYQLSDYTTAYPPIVTGPQVIPVTTAPPMYHPAVMPTVYLPPPPPQPPQPQPLCSVNPMVTPITLTQVAPQMIGGYAGVAARPPAQQNPRGQKGQGKQSQQYSSSGGRSPTQRNAAYDGSRPQLIRPPYLVGAAPMQAVQACNSTYGRPPPHLMAHPVPHPHPSPGTDKL